MAKANKVFILVTTYSLPFRITNEFVCRVRIEEDEVWLLTYPFPINFVKELEEWGKLKPINYKKQVEALWKEVMIFGLRIIYLGIMIVETSK